MADREFEEFRQYFEQLPQHIKAPSSCYTATEGETTLDGAGARDPVEEPLFIKEESYLCGKPLEALSESETVKERVNDVSKEASATHGKARAIGPKVSKTLVSFPTCLPDVLAGYDPDDIFSAGEFGLYYSLVPETRTTTTPRREFYGSSTKSDRRLTVLLAVNMSGTERLPLFVVGRLAMSSRGFRGVHTLPASYRSERNASLTAAIFEEWVRELDETFFNSQRSVVLVVEKSTAHPPLKNLRAITLIFFPESPNKIQPLRQGIIRQIKIHYKWGLLEKMSDCIRDRKNFTVPLPDALYRLRLSWITVSPDVITNAFRSCGFSSGSISEPVSEPVLDSPPFEVLKQNGLNIEDFNACVSADDNLATTASHETSALEILEESIDASIYMFQEGGASDYSDDGDLSETEPMPQQLPDAYRMRSAFWTIQSFLVASPQAAEMLDHLLDIQAFWYQINIKPQNAPTKTKHNCKDLKV